jgi:cell division protein FtsN
MPQDFAKPHRSTPPAPAGPGKWLWFFTGFISGGFATFLIALWLLVPVTEKPEEQAGPVAEPETQAEEMQWDFYEIFPKSVVPVVEDRNAPETAVTEGPRRWVLQAGSFSDPKDADELRASLILMGLEASITRVEVAGKDWHRVMVGPLENDLDKNRAQDKLAQAEIKAIPIRLK